MALINCPECGQSVSDKAEVCIHCGTPLREKPMGPVQVVFPLVDGIIARGHVYYNDKHLTCSPGNIISIDDITSPTEITVKMTGYLGSASIEARPGEKFKVQFNAFGKIRISKIDVITDNT